MSELSTIKKPGQTMAAARRKKKAWKQAQLDLETPAERAARRTREVLGYHPLNMASFPGIFSETKEQIRVKSAKLKGTL